MAKRLMCIMLMAVLFCGVLVGCANNTAGEGKDSATDTVVETDEWGQKVIDDGIPDELDYGGAEVSFLMRESTRFNREFGSEEFVPNASLLDSKIFDRNQDIEKNLGIDLKFHKTLNGGNNQEFYDTVTASKKADDGAYDVIAAYAYFGVTPQLRQCYVDLNSASATYLSSDKDYWNQSYIKEAELNGKLYYITGDVNLSTFDRSIVVYFNETKCAEHGIEGLYDLALNGQWTYETLFNYVENIPYEEIDNVAGKSDGDTFTMAAMKWSESYDGFLAAFDLEILTENDNGTYEITIPSNTKMSTAAGLISELYNQPGSYLAKSTGTVNELFATGKVLFTIDIMYRSETQNALYTGMKDSYGILPLPKYDAVNQTEYFTTPQDAYNIMSIMASSKVDPEMVSATLELLSSESYKNIRPYYFENIVKTRYFSGLKSAQVFDLVLDSVVFDTGVIYSSQLGGPTGVWRDACAGADLGQKYAEVESTISTELRKFEDWIAGT